jgi:hypothetical protein
MIKEQLREMAVAGLELAIEQLKAVGQKPHGEIKEILSRIKNPPTGIFKEEVHRVEAWWKYRCPDCGGGGNAAHTMREGAEHDERRHKPICPARVNVPTA